MNKTYFHLFMELRQLVSNKIPHTSAEAQGLIERIQAALTSSLSTNIDNLKSLNIQGIELYNPLNREEIEYLKKAYEFVDKDQMM
ncbi:hypothetical protein HOO54_03685 [Bacillus sp. WMMC1349]|uniref:hypothetical protein n=1 Tax=Bacillus sp. WMMC1349 TaxID=2736254 RepID=UPI0015545A52|nr:hypothetical protein [Bacillus sp. WMMC1349]NPC91367.1 hypothetical protein [Bacillus sp. WMMC1349]